MQYPVQDWEPVVFRKKFKPSELKSKDVVTQAQRTGKQVITNEKDKTREDRDRFRKLEADLNPNEEPAKLAALPTLSKTSQQAMIQARVAKGYTQVTLANAINEPSKVIQDLENGKVVNNNNLLTKVNRILGTKLRFGQ